MRPLILTAIVTLLVLARLTGARAATLEVPADYASIQAAIDAALDGDVVRVAAGTYVENLDFKGKAIVVQSAAGAAATIIDGFDLGPVVRFVTHEDRDSVIEGFTLQHGIGAVAGKYGGGVYCSGDAGPTIRANVITTNTASSVGGGVYAEGSVLVENNVITDNVDGGGIYCFGGSVEIRNNEIAANKGGSGIYCNNCAAVTIVANAVRNHSPRGGIQSWSSNFTLQTVVIDGNLIEGNASNGDAGGILLHQDHGVAYVSSNVIADNVSARHGGAIWWDTAVEITDNTIVGNAAVLGGGLYVEYATGGRITNNRIVANAATQDGGGLWIKYYQFSLSQNLFARNTAGALGGAIYSLISFPELSNLTFTGNSAASGGAIWFDYNTLRLTSCILWDDHAGTGAEIISPAGIPQISYSDVQGGFAGAGNIDADPRFTDPGGDDYSLATTSPCLDAGDPDARPGGHDVSANARFLDGNLDRVMRVDMGAEEFANVRLAVSGSATPGGTLTLTTTGKPDLFVVLFAGREPGEQLAAPYGALFFSLGAPWNYLPLGAIPGSGSFRVDAQVPTYLPLPFPLVLQEVAAQLVPSAGNVSNAIALTIE